MAINRILYRVVIGLKSQGKEMNKGFGTCGANDQED